jgi:multidrug transporter EmrE-like cation transporter
MNIEMNTIRLLGAAQLIVFISAMLSDRLLTSVVGSGSISDILVNISKNLTRMRISILVALVDSMGIVVLAVLFYVVFNEQYSIIALVALGFFLAEAITLAVSKIGAYALIPLSQEFVEAGAPESSYFQTLGDFLYYGVDRQGYHIHNLFFCLGGILWYYLFFRSGYIPQVLAVWGFAAVGLLSVAVLLVLYNRDFTRVMILALPYAPYELVLGVWLIVKGFN